MSPIFKNFPIFVKVIAIVFLFLALFTFPIDFYKIVRIVVTSAAIISAYFDYKKNNCVTPLVFIYGIIALIFNPIFLFYLGKTLWKIMDLVTLLIFGGTVYSDMMKNNKNIDK
jgi:hypothetical protein